ncbi:E3 UFM1-protein ligase 1-like [Liolophura sinensis]|uniref:E3 UFM1-protein ligase 1-like n=1 Tax=Liolophura sinensis TaxID=3198878 RepID=UPI003158FFDC
MADWEEIRRLAADFQRAQLSSTVQRLSERNCVEIVNKLVELKLIDVLHTQDGKEYITPQNLSKEIRDELFVHGGRINLVELQQILNVDFSHVESKVSEIVRHDKNLTLILGQLIDMTYLERLADEVNDRLQEQGQVTIAELAKLYDLPGQFLSEVILEQVGNTIHGHVDNYNRDVLYTDALVARHKSKIQGAFSAVTRPTSVHSVMHRYGLQERLFHSVLEELVSSKRLAGSVSGGRQEKATYIPDIYTKSQNNWIDSFYKQNGYLEYDSVRRLGIGDAKSFIQKRFKGEPILYLSSCCAGKSLQEQVEASVEESLSQGLWIDIMPLLPSVFSTEDASILLTGCLKKHPDAVLFCDTIAASNKFITECSKSFTHLINKKADKEAKNNPSLFTSTSQAGGAKVEDGREDKKEQRRKRAAAGSGSTKSGGGAQGREIKTKSTKKKGGKRQEREDSDEEGSSAVSDRLPRVELEFLRVEEIEEELKKQPFTSECPEDFMTEIARQLYRPLSKQYQETAKSIFLQSAGAATTSSRKKTHGELQEKISGLWTNARLFEKGIKFFSEDTQSQLIKHLLRTVCSDITNLGLSALATDNMLSVTDENSLTPEARSKLIGKLPEKPQAMMSKLNNTLGGKSLEEFFTQFDALCSEYLGIMLKKPDKKKERQLVFTHRQGLAEQLQREDDPAMTLHLTVTILFQTFTQTMVHAPGRVVPQIMQFLEDKMEKPTHEVLTQFQDLVVSHMKMGEEEKEAKARLCATMSEMIPQVRVIALTTKRSTQTTEND